MSYQLTQEQQDTISRILAYGNQAEVKIEHSQIVVVEIRRKLRSKSA